MSRIQKNNTSFLNLSSVRITNSWGGLSTGLGGVYGYGNSVVTDATNNMYVGGSFTQAGGLSVNNVARWNGTSWIPLGASTYKGVNLSTESNASEIYDLTVDNSGNLYVGGRFDQAGNFVETNYIAKWDGSVWSALGSGMGGVSPFVYALASDNQNNIYAGGFFITAGGISVNRIARWNGSTWSALGSGIGNGFVNDIVVDNSNSLLYAAGDFVTAGGITVNNIARWNLNSSTWSSLSSGANDILACLALDNNNNLYAGGFFTTMGGIPANYIARWDGSSWSALPSQVNNSVYDLTFKNGKLYACGSFTQAGSVDVSGLAVWDGNAWSGLNVIIDAQTNGVAVDNNNKVYITGIFTSPGVGIAQQIQTITTSSVIIPSSSANSKRIRTI